ncbi:hypothetical protein BWI92_17890 [Flectobacillus sp. BAB-3569]|nr:hypothetical protein BWI92_17890 [Flectobacillus sp. BAB-3569]
MKMMKNRLLLTLIILYSWSGFAQKAQYQGNKAPLAPLKYIELPLGAVKPQGWLRQQLEVMKKGATGHLDEYFPKIQNDNGWLGGKGDAWEETPYWLDGAVPLAYLLEDKALTLKVQKYIDWTLSTQRSNGFFGPLTNEEREGKPISSCEQGADWWPRMVMLKVLQQYYTATKDTRVIPFMTKYFHYQLQSIKACPLNKWTDWARARGGDNIMSAYWLYNQTGDKSLLELADILYQQTTPWTQYMAERNWVMQASANQTGESWMDRHAVNVGMGIKLPAIYYQSQKTDYYLKAMSQGWKDIMTLHGLPHGMFSGDEDLHGNEPSQGVELCAIVETMFSLENVLGITGDPMYAQALERMTYNALPTQTTDDYISRQYFQTANQVEVRRGTYDFSLPFYRGMNNVFGPYAGYTCCTSNMHQGWTKFVSHLWYATPQNGLASLLYGPSSIKAKVGNGIEVYINESTNYPFEDQINFELQSAQAVTFPWEFRIPEWCQEATISINGKEFQKGKASEIVKIQRQWQPGDKVTLHFPSEVRTSVWAHNSRVVEKGPLVYALKIEEEWNKKEIKEEGTFYEILPKSPWNFGIPTSVAEKPSKFLQVSSKGMPQGYVWNAQNAPIEIKLSAKQIPAWVINNDGVARIPVTTRDGFYQGAVDSKEQTITLIPYGCSKLRVVAFPLIK